VGESTVVKAGDRVTWKDPDPDDPIGTVRDPTAEELVYVATWARSARSAIKGHVIVVFDGDDPEDGGWTDPDDLIKVAP
jgi:hypothetical protein